MRAQFFNKDPFNLTIGGGSVTLAYRPIPVAGRLTPTRWPSASTWASRACSGGEIPATAWTHQAALDASRRPLRCSGPAEADPPAQARACRGSSSSIARREPGARSRSRTGRPSTSAGRARFVDPAFGTVLVRLTHERQDAVGLQLALQMEGTDGVTAIVAARGLVKRYNGTLALGGLDLEIAAGEIFGLVGPNGAGKTTTLRILATLLVPTAGDAEVAGASIRGDPDGVRRVVGYMPDSFGVYDDMKVWEYLDFFGRCHGLPADRRRRMIGDLLELVDLGPKRDAYVARLSRGMQQRLCLAHALVHDPAVLILDEPASGLDPRARVELRELLRELRTLGKTILVSSHILPELEELCTSLAIIDRGRVLAQGRLAEIEARLRVGAVLRLQVLGDGAALPQRVTTSPAIRPSPSPRSPVRGTSRSGSPAMTRTRRASSPARWPRASASRRSPARPATSRSSSCR